MLYKEYEPKILKKLQTVEAEMLVDFNKLCEDNGIDYFAVGGTLIGTIRHKGFIPWDDDIDLGMSRENYEKFLKVADNAFDDKYRIINYESNPNFIGMFTKWYKVGTIFRDKDAVATDYTAGIAFDIFCFENVPDDIKRRHKQGRRAWLWQKMYVLRSIGKPTIYAYGLTAKLGQIVATIGNGVLRLFHVSSSFLYRKTQKEAQKYSNDKTGFISYLYDPKPNVNVISREDLEPTRWADFENIKVKVPHNAEKYLTERFGDYMTLPPEDRRHNHPPIKLSFGDEE